MIAVGDKVAVLDEAISGVVTAIIGDKITIEDDHGFALIFSRKEVVKITGSSQIRTSGFDDIQEIIKQKEPEAPKKATTPKSKKKVPPAMEVDLHIYKLVKSTKGMSNFDMLNLQLDTAKRQLDFAIRKRIQRVIFIHGVGQGVLKTELSYVFGGYENVKVYEADYKKYGQGATEVYILQNPKSS